MLQLWIVPVVSRRKEHKLNMAGFKNLEDLVGDLEAGLQKLRAGKLEPEELTPLVDDARELCDRLVLLRFKAHEFAYEVRRKGPEGGLDEQAADRTPVRPFRIGAAYQTSLIDAIEEVSREQAEQAADARRQAGTPDLFDAAFDEPFAPVPGVTSPAEQLEAETPVEEVEAETPVEDVEADTPVGEVEADTPVEEVEADTPVEEVEVTPSESMTPAAAGAAPAVAVDAAPSLAEQMEKKAIGDLKTAFSLVEKYECIKGLFQDDAVLFDRVLEALDDAGDYQLALLWLQQHVPGFEAWDQEDPTVLRFLDRIQRRYA